MTDMTGDGHGAVSDRTRQFRIARTASVPREGAPSRYAQLISPIECDSHLAAILQRALRHRF